MIGKLGLWASDNGKKLGAKHALLAVVSALILGFIFVKLGIPSKFELRPWMLLLWALERLFFAFCWLALYSALDYMFNRSGLAVTYSPPEKISYDNPLEEPVPVSTPTAWFWLGCVLMLIFGFFILPEIVLQISHWLFM